MSKNKIPKLSLNLKLTWIKCLETWKWNIWMKIWEIVAKISMQRYVCNLSEWLLGSFGIRWALWVTVRSVTIAKVLCASESESFRSGLIRFSIFDDSNEFGNGVRWHQLMLVGPALRRYIEPRRGEPRCTVYGSRLPSSFPPCRANSTRMVVTGG